MPRPELDDALASPRLNDRYHLFGRALFTRWRLIQAAALMFAVVTMFGFWQINHERDQRREDICTLANDGRAGIRQLLEALTTPRPPAEGQPPPTTTPEQAAGAARLRDTALRILPPLEYRNGECVVAN